jgi:phosphatidylserine/phosphatidylglycerophosphate/cardiolipin synthase-like enzyme
MRAANRPQLQIIIILPKRPQALLEEISVGITQTKILRSLKDVAGQTGHSLGVYYTAPISDSGIEMPVYIHSKLLMVDDRFMTVGSANTTNRSMGLDTELNVSWEATSLLQHKLIRAIRQIRVALLSEHAGVPQCKNCSGLQSISGLVRRLNDLADRLPYRLRKHTMDTLFDKSEWLKALKPEGFPFDPERPLIEENLYELFSPDKGSIFAEGITLLKRWLLEKRTTPVDPEKPSPR